MEAGAYPEDIEERPEGVIAFIDRITPDGCDALIDDDCVHDGAS